MHVVVRSILRDFSQTSDIVRFGKSVADIKPDRI
jgi:hypothetical protein